MPHVVRAIEHFDPSLVRSAVPNYLLAEMTAEMAQLRAELESTRAVAARLAGLVRNRAAGAQLVPVRNVRTGTRPGTSASPPAGEQPTAPGTAGTAHL